MRNLGRFGGFYFFGRVCDGGLLPPFVYVGPLALCALGGPYLGLQPRLVYAGALTLSALGGEDLGRGPRLVCTGRTLPRPSAWAGIYRAVGPMCVGTDANSGLRPGPMYRAVGFRGHDGSGGGCAALGGMACMARSVRAVMVRAGLTPRLALITEPSQM